MGKGRKILRAILVVAALVGVGFAIEVATFDRQRALRDYDQLKRGMAQYYANLDWQRDHRGLDLVALDRETKDALEAAYGRIGAYFVFKDFVAKFEDPHLQLAWGDPPDWTHVVSQSALDPSAVGALCEGEGYEAEDLAGSIDFAAIDGWRSVESAYFPAGVAGSNGVLRIAEFGENKYRRACESAQPSDDSPRAVQLATRAVLQAELRATIGRLAEAGAKRLLIDVTGNGGGSEWASAAAALFTPQTLKRLRPRVVDAACDRTGVWKGEDVCPIFKAEAEAQMDEVAGEGVWSGPVFVLVDGGSASATEAFAALLSSGEQTLLVGERTLGAGCGFINGGNAVRLESLPLHVTMPNCSRFTLDGVNEIEGLEPDLAMDWSKPGAARDLIEQLGD